MCVCVSRSLLMFTMENCFYVLISQAVRCLKDPSTPPRDKQGQKQELSSDLVRLPPSPPPPSFLLSPPLSFSPCFKTSSLL